MSLAARIATIERLATELQAVREPIVNVLMWDAHATPTGIASLVVCLAGGCLYQQAPLRPPPEDKLSPDIEFSAPRDEPAEIDDDAPPSRSLLSGREKNGASKR